MYLSDCKWVNISEWIYMTECKWVNKSEWMKGSEWKGVSEIDVLNMNIVSIAMSVVSVNGVNLSIWWLSGHSLY